MNCVGRLSKRLQALTFLGLFSVLAQMTGCEQLTDKNSVSLKSGGGGGVATLSIVEGNNIVFGACQLSQTVQRVIHLQNTGTGTATQISLSLAAPFSTASSNCGSSITAGTTCAVTLNYSPQTNSDSTSSSLKVSYSGGSASAITTALSGQTAAFIELQVQNKGAFGTLRTGAVTGTTLSATLRNLGQSNATNLVGSIDQTGTPFSVSTVAGSNTCPATGILLPSQSCKMTLVVNTATPYTEVAPDPNYQLSYSDQVGQVVSVVPLTATVKNGATISVMAVTGGSITNTSSQTPPPYLISPSSNVFVGSMVSLQLTLQNTGPGNATKGSFDLQNNPNFALDPNATGTGFCIAQQTFTPGQQCILGLLFTPQVQGTIKIATNYNFTDSVSNNSTAITITGGGVPVLGVTLNGFSVGSPPSSTSALANNTFAFGSQTPNVNAPMVLVLQNNSATQAVSINGSTITFKGSYAFNGGNYPGLRGNCGTMLNAAASCNVDIVYQAGAIGSSSAGEMDYSYSVGSAGPFAGKVLLTGAAIDCTSVASFGTSGEAVFNPATYLGSPSLTFPPLGPGGVLPRGVLIQSTGKIVVGAINPAFPDKFALIRFNCDGGQDPTFGQQGVATASPSTTSYIHDIALQGTNIVAVGQATNSSGMTLTALARFDAQGNLDTSFGSSGFVTNALGAQGSVGNSLVIDAAQNIYVGGMSNPGNYTPGTSGVASMLLSTYSSNGTLGTKLEIPYSPSSGQMAPSRVTIVKLVNGNLVFAGDENSMLAVAQVPAQVSSLANPTIQTYSSARISPFDISATSAGDYYFTGSYSVSPFTQTNSAIGHLLSDGSLDPAFGTGGVFVLPSDTPSATYSGFGLLGNTFGLMVAGFGNFPITGQGNVPGMQIARFLPSSETLDKTFTKTGYLDPTFKSGNIEQLAMAIRPISSPTAGFTLIYGTIGGSPAIVRVSDQGVLK